MLRVPRYDFGWQTTYALQEPLVLSPGSEVRSVAHFDSSVNDRHSPDPAKTVYWGDQTCDEMHIAFVEVVIDPSMDPRRLTQ